MDEQVVRHYLSQVPVEIREAVMELDTPYKWAVYIALTTDGDKYFNQVKKEFGANPKTLTDIIRALMAGGLVDRKVKQLADAGDTNKNYYTSTKLGEKLLMNLNEVVLPPLAIPDTRNEQIEIIEPPVECVELAGPGQQYIPYEFPEGHASVMLEGVQT